MTAVPVDPASAAHTPRTPRADVVICPGGPMLLRGEHVVEDDEGVLHTTERPVSAVCRCGKTATKPWCDGTHKKLPRKLRP